MTDKKPLSVGVAFITHCAKQHLSRCLPPILSSSIRPRVLVVNSSSGDGTVETAQKLGVETLVIPRKAFNHGATREVARHYLNTDIVVMMTPDAYAVDNTLLEKLIAPLILGQASLSYARQIAHDGADFFESFHRQYNYPEKSHIRGLQDVDKYGIYTFFCSNSCAAYLNNALNEVNGFQPVLLGEDTIVTARLLKKGHKIAYTADAIVKHSHRYTLLQEFQRHFDTGLARRSYQNLLTLGGSDSARGRDYVYRLFSRLAKHPHLFPYALLHILAKWTGYQIGKNSASAPLWMKKLCTSQDFYWTSDH